MSRRPLRALAVLAAAAIAAASCSSSNPAALDECERTTDPDHSVARVWNEVLLQAIRQDFPAPTVHSRNLFHVSAAMWDTWAAYDDTAVGYFIDQKLDADDVTEAREEAMSFAAYRILVERYKTSVRAGATRARLDVAMESLCFDASFTAAEGEEPAAFGNLVAQQILEFGRTDGSLEESFYIDDSYQPVNEPLVVAEPGAVMVDPNRWQPLKLDVFIAQNGLPLDIDRQAFVGPHWGFVTPFALEPSPDGLPIDPGPPPYLGNELTDDEFKAAAVEVVRFSSFLDPSSRETIDISPGRIGNTPLGTYDGQGHALNPVTGEPYSSNEVPHGDFGRVLAEFWADGPASETPPGHWNTIANATSDAVDELRIGGDIAEVDRLEWDVKLYFAVNGALHDAAVAAWGAKGLYDYARPISMIRYMGGLGHSSKDVHADSFHEAGLPLELDVVDVITDASVAPGERHAHLADHVGEVAVRAWTGEVEDRETTAAGVDWIRAVAWVPYQQSTFVTPSFAGYVSGHSTFSRAAAEVLAGFTGSEFFPGGLSEWTIEADALEFEAGPATPVTLQWATYYDAADQAGISRLYGGIHVRADDLAGRIMGADVGQRAWDLAQTYFAGSAEPVL